MMQINKTIVFNKVSFGQKSFKDFIGYQDKAKVKPSYIMLPNMREYAKSFNETKYVPFLIKDDELLEKYNKIWDIVSNSIKKGFDNDPVQKKKYLKTKAKSYEGKINTNFYNNRTPKEGSQCISVIMLINYAFKIGKN